MGKRLLITVLIFAAATVFGTWITMQPHQYHDSEKHTDDAPAKPTGPTAAAHGVVARAADHAPIAGATIRLIPSDEHRIAKLSAQSDKQGHWKLGAIPPGEYSMSVTAGGFASTVQSQLVLKAGSDRALDSALRPRP